MSPARAKEEVRLRSAAPELPTASLERTKAWYEQRLGFTCVGPWQEWNFLILEREGVRLHFTPTDAPEAAAAGTIYLRLASGVDALAASLEAAGEDLHDGAQDRPWGMREFTVHDPDGRHLRIGQELRGP